MAISSISGPPTLAGGAKLVRAQLLEPRHDPASGGDGDQLDLRAADPSDGGQVALKEKMVGLVVETPLADCKVSAGRLHVVDHLLEGLLLILTELLVVFHVGHVQLVLGLRLWGLKGAGE